MSDPNPDPNPLGLLYKLKLLPPSKSHLPRVWFGPALPNIENNVCLHVQQRANKTRNKLPGDICENPLNPLNIYNNLIPLCMDHILRVYRYYNPHSLNSVESFSSIPVERREQMADNPDGNVDLHNDGITNPSDDQKKHREFLQEFPYLRVKLDSYFTKKRKERVSPTQNNELIILADRPSTYKANNEIDYKYLQRCMDPIYRLANRDWEIYVHSMRTMKEPKVTNPRPDPKIVEPPKDLLKQLQEKRKSLDQELESQRDIFATLIDSDDDSSASDSSETLYELSSKRQRTK